MVSTIPEFLKILEFRRIVGKTCRRRSPLIAPYLCLLSRTILKFIDGLRHCIYMRMLKFLACIKPVVDWLLVNTRRLVSQQSGSLGKLSNFKVLSFLLIELRRVEAVLVQESGRSETQREEQREKERKRKRNKEREIRKEKEKGNKARERERKRWREREREGGRKRKTETDREVMLQIL